MFRFTIVIPSFRDLRILETIASIDRQTFDRNRVSVRVVDGGSGPEFCARVREVLKGHDRMISESDLGIFDGINKGIGAAEGEVIVVLGSDDRLRVPRALEVIDEIFTPEVDFAVSGTVYTSEDWTPRRAWPATRPSRRNLLWGRQVSHFAFYARPRLYERVGLFDLRYRTAADYDFFWRVANTPDLVSRRINHYLVEMRLGGNSSKNLRNVVQGNREILQALQERTPLAFLPMSLKPAWKAAEFIRALFLRSNSTKI